MVPSLRRERNVPEIRLEVSRDREVQGLYEYKTEMNSGYPDQEILCKFWFEV